MTDIYADYTIIPCEHLTEEGVREDVNSQWGRMIVAYAISLGDKKIACLCRKCTNAIAYEMVTRFNKDSSHEPARISSYPVVNY